MKNKQNESRENQTGFFMKLALDDLPKWITEDIEDGKMSVCDAGCAQGAGTAILSAQFPDSQVTGIDFSPNAVARAKELHPACEFRTGDIRQLPEEYDVIVSSNVLEHFYHSDQIMQSLAGKAKRYCILLLPFREYYTIPEHASYFDFQSFPLEIGGTHKLCFFKELTMQGEQEKYWYGEQILVVYGQKEHLSSQNLTLRNLYNGYIEERTNIITHYDTVIHTLNQQLEESESEKKNFVLSERFSELYQDYTEAKKQITAYYMRELEKAKLANEKLEEENAAYREVISSLEENEVQKDEIIKKYARDLKHTSKELELRQSEKTYDAENLQNIQQILEGIRIQQNSRIYRIGLVFKRFLIQCIQTRDRKDFVKWLQVRFLKKPYRVKALGEFDELERVKQAASNIYCSSMQEEPQEHASVCFKQTPKIIIFASVPFYDVGGGQRSAQFARTFHALGWQVFYIYGFPCTEKNAASMFIPAVLHRQIDEMTQEQSADMINGAQLAVFEIPYFKFEPFLDLAKQTGCVTVYEQIDNWDSSLGSLFYDDAVFQRFLEKADFITVTARKLGEKIREHTSRSYLYLPNAVNTELFEPSRQYPCPSDLKRGSKTLIYFGSLWGEWFEWDKIDYLAEKCPECEINLIGDYSGCMERFEKKKKHVHFLGLKKQTELPAYLQYSDYALLPFKNSTIGAYVSPLKIFEYIAMNKRVLATSLDDIRNYPNVFCSDSKKDWAEYLKQEPQSLEDSSIFTARNNWFARCEKLLELVPESAKSPDRGGISVIVLNHNNRTVIHRCVESLLIHNRRYQYEILVVDNASTDGSYEELEQAYQDKIILVKNNRNGCSSGRNLGVKHASGKYICFLDSDQWVVSDYWLDSVLKLLQEQTAIGAAAWNAGWFSKGQTTGPIVDYLPQRAVSHAKIWYRTDIAYLATSGFVMERVLFEQVGGFDESYDPTCYEDTDLSLKIRDAGYELAYCPYMAIMHLPHQTTQSGSHRHTKLMEKNGAYFKKKWEEKNPELLEYYL